MRETLRARLRPDGFSLLLVGLAAFGALGVWVREIPYGAGVTVDSTIYIAAARSALAGEGFLDWRGVPLTVQPPLFPAALALIGWFGPAPAAVAGPLNAVAFGATLLVWTRWLRRRLRCRWLAAWLGLVLAVSPPLVHVSTHIWSEPLFILFCTLGLVCLDRFRDTQRPAPLLWAALYAALACLTRALGLAVIAAGASWLLLPRTSAFWIRARRALIFGTLAAGPFGLWIGRNIALAGTVGRSFGTPQGEAWLGSSWLSNMALGVVTLVEWVLGRFNLHVAARTWLAQAEGAPALAVQIGIALLWALGLGGLTYASRTGVLRWRQPGTAELLLLFIGFYAGLLLVAINTTHESTEPINHRYLAPLYAPCAFLAAWSLDVLFQRAAPRSRSRPSLWAGSALAVLSLGLWPHFQLYARLFQAHWQRGAAFTNTRWVTSETLAYLRTHPLEGGVVWANDSGQLAFHVDPPVRYPTFHFNATMEEVGQRLQRMGNGGTDVHVVWFFGQEPFRPPFYETQDVRNLPGMKPVAELADGFIQRFQPGYVNDYARTLQAQYAALSARSPQIRSVFDVYATADEVVYVKEACRPEDTRPKFILHAFPADPQVLPASRQGLRFDNLDFTFERFGAWLDGACVLRAPLPDYRIVQISVGQYLPGQASSLWQADISLTASDPDFARRRQALYRELASRSPQVRSVFDVYVTEDAVIYVKEACRPEDTRPKFVLHVFPEQAQALPAQRQAFGFDNLDFQFAWQGAHFDGVCLAQAPLPTYAIDRLRVGQWIARENRTVWESEISVRALTLQAAYPALAAREPDRRSAFDVYVQEDAVIYVKEACRPEDTLPKFVLRIVPVNRWHLPWPRWLYGFDNRSFPFAEYGTRFDGICLAQAPLPAYAIDRLRVGQRTTRANRIAWEVEIPLAASARSARPEP